MKKFLVLCVLAVTLWQPSFAAAQEDVERTFRQIQRAFAHGDTGSLIRISGEHLEVTLFGMPTLYSRAQTEYVLRAFFREHPPERFVLERRLRSGDDWYAVGQYWHRREANPYRVTIRLHPNGDRLEIRTIQIETRGK